MPKTEEFKNTKTHTVYRLSDGTRVPGVTTILNVLDKPALIHWAWKLGCDGIDYRKYRDATAEVGTLAHYLVECDLAGTEPDLTAYSQETINKAENCLISYYEWRKDKTVEPILVEEALVSEKYGYGGTCDFYGYINGTLCLADLKTGKAIYPEMIHQLAAYRQLLEENDYPLQGVRILRIGRDETEGFEERVKTKKELKPHWKIFKACLDIYNEKKKIKEG